MAMEGFGFGAIAGDEARNKMAAENARVQQGWQKINQDNKNEQEKQDMLRENSDFVKEQTLRNTDFLQQKAVAEFKQTQDNEDRRRLEADRAFGENMSHNTFNEHQTVRKNDWEAEAERQKQAIQQQVFERNQQEAEKYRVAFQEEKSQRENRLNALKSSTGVLLSMMAENGGVLPVSSIKLFNEQFEKEGLKIKSGVTSKDGSGLLMFEGPNGEENPQYIPPENVMQFKEWTFGKQSQTGRTSRYGSDEETLALRENALKTRTIQGYLSGLERTATNIQKALADPATNPAAVVDLKKKLSDTQDEIYHYSAQAMEAAGLNTYKRKDTAEVPAPKSVKQTAFDKLKGANPQPVATQQQDSSGDSPADETVQIILPSGSTRRILKIHLPEALKRGAHLMHPME